MNDIASAEAEATEDCVKNSVSRVFTGWKPHFRDLLAVLLATEAHVNIPGLSMLDHPESAFTVPLLREWHMHALTSKKGAYNYIYALRRLSNNSAPQTIKNRYREFNIISRIWRHLTMMKRAGNFHGLVLPNRDPQSLTVPCFTCPWPGMNMPRDWKDTPTSLAYIHVCELGGDGNHSLQKKRKHDDLNDVSLGLGQGYFVHPDKITWYMESIEAEPAPETCSGFKVARAQHPGKFRNLEVSGVVVVICIRHGCFCLGAMVDLQKGERFGHMDFALAGALAGLDELLHIIFTYDVTCIYKVNIFKQFGARFSHLIPLVNRIQMLLPKLHMLTHKEACQVLYALCYTWGTGLTHGESVEHPWAEHNQAGLSTHEMGAGHHHDALNDIHNYWNWQKVENVGTFLARKLSEGFKGQECKAQLYDTLTEVAGSEKVARWEAMDVNPKQKGKQVESVYTLNDAKVSSAGRAYQELAKIEVQPKEHQMNLTASKATSGAAQFLKTALQLEQRHLRRDLDKWHQQQVTFMPKVELPDAEEVEDDEDNEMHGRPELEALALPSDFSSGERKAFALEILATPSRNHYGIKLIKLGIDNDDNTLRAIDLKKDLTIKNLQVARSLGDSKEVRAWFWNVVPPGTTAQDFAAWSSEVEQVEWFCARADKHRHDEEVNKLHKEFRRTIHAWRRMDGAWRNVGEKEGMERGARAYAMKKARMYGRKAAECEVTFSKARKDVDGEKLDYSQLKGVTTAVSSKSKHG
ncbi:hypothetical protein BKA93DRAFT_830299 [Sparassis latifolia]